MKVCPILKAARISSEVGFVESAKCLKEDCEWYGAGCPAYPNQVAVNLASKEDAKKD